MAKRKIDSISGFYKPEKEKGGELHFREAILRTIRDQMDSCGLDRPVAEVLMNFSMLVDNYSDIQDEN